MPYTLARSTVPPLWRDKNPGTLMPAPVTPGQMTEATGRAIVASAKKRWDLTMGSGGAVDYAQLRLDGGQLQGFCFVVADEVERCLVAQGEPAKTVRVTRVGGGADHYFTIVNRGNAGNSIIVDTTWKQFSGYDPATPYCLAGTLGAIKFVLGDASGMVEMYSAGMTVLGQWTTYQCFDDA